MYLIVAQFLLKCLSKFCSSNHFSIGLRQHWFVIAIAWPSSTAFAMCRASLVQRRVLPVPSITRPAPRLLCAGHNSSSAAFALCRTLPVHHRGCLVPDITRPAPQLPCAGHHSSSTAFALCRASLAAAKQCVWSSPRHASWICRWETTLYNWRHCTSAYIHLTHSIYTQQTIYSTHAMQTHLIEFTQYIYA